MRQLHFDRGSLSRPTTAPDGALIIDGIVGRVHLPGDALDYGSHVEHRDLAAVALIVAQLANLPVTNDHPATMFHVSRQPAVGVVERGWLDGDRAAARIRVTDRTAIAAVRSGKRQLSLGYGADVRTDARGLRWQTAIRLDHLSLVAAARCGNQCSLKTDSTQGSGMCSCKTEPQLDGLQREIAARKKMQADHAAMAGQTALAETVLVAIADEHSHAPLVNVDGMTAEQAARERMRQEFARMGGR